MKALLITMILVALSGCNGLTKPDGGLTEGAQWAVNLSYWYCVADQREDKNTVQYTKGITAYDIACGIAALNATAAMPSDFLNECRDDEDTQCRDFWVNLATGYICEHYPETVENLQYALALYYENSLCPTAPRTVRPVFVLTEI